MDREIRALLVHAAYCRAIAAEITHERAADRLRGMAAEYESRAQKLGAVTFRLPADTTPTKGAAAG